MIGFEEVRVERKSDKRLFECCCLCKFVYSLDDCGKFVKMLYVEKLEVVKSNGFCLGCLCYGYMKRDCCGKKVCVICKGFYLIFLYNMILRVL